MMDFHQLPEHPPSYEEVLQQEGGTDYSGPMSPLHPWLNGSQSAMSPRRKKNRIANGEKTMYLQLRRTNSVSFFPYPSEQTLGRMHFATAETDPADLAHLATGQLMQLPAQISLSPAKLAWIFHQFANVDVHVCTRWNDGTSIEDKNTSRIVFFDDAETLAAAHYAISQRLLVDHFGVWFAMNDHELAAMSDCLRSAVRYVPKMAVTLKRTLNDQHFKPERGDSVRLRTIVGYAPGYLRPSMRSRVTFRRGLPPFESYQHASTHYQNVVQRDTRHSQQQHTRDFPQAHQLDVQQSKDLVDRPVLTTSSTPAPSSTYESFTPGVTSTTTNVVPPLPPTSVASCVPANVTVTAEGSVAVAQTVVISSNSSKVGHAHETEEEAPTADSTAGPTEAPTTDPTAAPTTLESDTQVEE